MLFQPPPVTDREAELLDEIEAIRKEVTGGVPAPREWTGLPWRAMLDPGEPGSVGREGEEASAYRRALTRVLRLAEDPGFTWDQETLRSLHRVVVNDDPARKAGRWRRSRVFVRLEHGGDVVYHGPDPRQVPALVAELLASLNRPPDVPPIVRAATVHLNVAGIHAFLDGNGRIARALHTFVLARAGVVMPPFASMDEYLGVNGGAYELILRTAHGGFWQPERDARPFVRFCIRAHHRQATLLRRRAREYDELWQALDAEVGRRGLPGRLLSALADAAISNEVTATTYGVLAGVSPPVADRDLRRLVREGLLDAGGSHGRAIYHAADAVRAIRARTIVPDPMDMDPFAIR
jgi:Fic family protein